MVVTAHLWGSQWSKKHVLFRSDNEATVAILSTRTSKVPVLMHLLRDLLLSAARWGFSFSSAHVPGVDNKVADAISRFHWQEFRQSGSGGSCVPMPSPAASFGQLDSSLLDDRCRFFLAQGLAQSTRKSYASGQQRFIEFCRQAGKLHPDGSPCPVEEWTLCLFVSFLADSIQHASIKVYLSAIRSLHIEQGFPDPLPNCLRLQRVMRGIKRSQGSPVAARLPITDSLMMVIRQSLNVTLHDHCMFWAACTLAYFGFLRSSEFTVPTLASFSSAIHLSVADIAVDSSTLPSCLRVRIKASKTDPFRKGCFVHIGRWNSPVVCSSCCAGISFSSGRLPWSIVPPAEWTTAVSYYLD